MHRVYWLGSYLWSFDWPLSGAVHSLVARPRKTGSPRAGTLPSVAQHPACHQVPAQVKRSAIR